MSVPGRGEVYLIALDSARGKEIQKTRPCVVVSPDELNDHLATFIVAPLTMGGHSYPFRIPCRFQRKSGFVVLDQLRTVDRNRLVRKLGSLSPKTIASVLGTLQDMFAA
jgi:mRNA interferase MazF